MRNGLDGQPGQIYTLRAVPTISTDEAEDLVDEGTTYLDVRTVEEFEDGHVPSAVNIPVSLSSPTGNTPNPDFVAIVEANYDKDEKLIIGCKAGGRSARAVTALEAVGFTNLLDMSAGWIGKKDAFGEVTPGWQAEGREVEMDAEEEQTYAFRKTKAGL